jgi:glycosyltransferase involved in cell wall biosynthesis
MAQRRRLSAHRRPLREVTIVTPTVSVVIPAYNAERFLAETLDSVLAQTWTDFECIVVDDGSTDSTAQIIQAVSDPRIRYVWKENRGTVADARNTGIALATGEFVALLDSDDIWLSRKLEEQVRLFRAKPHLGLVFCGYAISNQHLKVRTVIYPDRDDFNFRRWILLEGNGIAPSSTAMIRRSVTETIGPFRLELSVSEDAEYAERIAQRHDVDAVDECLAIYRTHPDQGHRSLAAFEHDVHWIYADRFSGDDPASRAARRRGLANLYTRLAAYELRNRNVSRSASHLRTALRLGAIRVMMLPLEALLRRTRRRINRVRRPWPRDGNFSG